MSDLKPLPCPFCGGINIINCGLHKYCHSCGAEGPDADSGTDAGLLAAWNRRAQPAQAGQLHQALTDPENQPNQYGVEFLMHGPKFAFKVGAQQFTLDYEPTEPGEFEFMRDMLIHAFTTFTPDVKPAQAGQVLTEDQVVAMRSEHGWAKETIRAIESAVLARVATVPKDMKLVGYYHKAPSGDPHEDDFFFADAINGDCPHCHPCYMDASVVVHPTPAAWKTPMTEADLERITRDPITVREAVRAAERHHGIVGEKGGQ